MAPNPKHEIPGNPAAIDETANSMTKLGTAFDNAGQGFRKINTGGWTGQTADAFHDYFQQEPPKWFRASDAFTTAGKELKEYRDVLDWAQRQAEQACAELEKAEQRTEQAAKQYENSNATTPFQDPAAGARAQAQAMLDDAKNKVEQAAVKASAALIQASELAPPQPGLLTQLAEAGEDLFQNVAEAYGHFWKGSFEGALELIQQSRQLNPLDPFNLTHPKTYAGNVGELVSSTFAAGTALVTDPVGTGKAMISQGIDGFAKDPGGFIGKLAPDLAVGLVTGGSSSAGKLAGKLGDVIGDTGKVTRQLDNVPHEPPWGHQDWAPTPARDAPTWNSPVDDGQPFGPKGSDWVPEDNTPDSPHHAPDHEAPQQHEPEPESDTSPEPDPAPERREIDPQSLAELKELDQAAENAQAMARAADNDADRIRLFNEMKGYEAEAAAIRAKFGL